MFSGQQPGWGIILLGLWGIGALGWFLKSQTWREQALHPRLVQGLLFLCLLLALMDPKIMYSQIAPANPALLSKGPIQIFPKTTMIYLQATLILSLGLLAMTILIRGKLQAWQRTIGILLVALAACSHLLVFRIVPLPPDRCVHDPIGSLCRTFRGSEPLRHDLHGYLSGAGVEPHVLRIPAWDFSLGDFWVASRRGCPHGEFSRLGRHISDFSLWKSWAKFSHPLPLCLSFVLRWSWLICG